MTIDEAITELTKVVGKWQYGASNSRDSALKLGIEALKAVKQCRASHMFCPGLTMPGETEK